MKICVVGTRRFPFIEGGVEKHCESLYPLIGKNNDVEIIVFRRRPYVKQHTVYKNIKFIDLPSTRIKGIEAILHSFLSTLYAIKLRPDVVHFHNIGPALFAPLLRLFSIPVVMTYHSPNYEHKKWGGFAKKLLLLSEKVALKCSDRIIFVNSFQMQKYSEQIQKKSVYIPNGIHNPIATKNNEFLKKIDVESRKYILSVGRITPEKGFDTLIKAYKIADVREYKIVIAGGVEFENGYMKQLQEMSEGLPVIFTGYVYGDNLAQLYSNAALYVLPSNNEGFPLVLLEAMSYKLDVLVSDIPATHLVKLDKSDYFSRGSSEMLAEKMRTKLQEPKPREYDLSIYDWNKNALQVLTIFHELVKSR